MTDLATERRREQVGLRDGVRLATNVVLPRRGGPWPALLIRTPYSLPNGDDIVKAFVHRDGPEAAAAEGWAVVIQDVRGRFESEGEFDPLRQEIPDGVDAVAWCATQPWCDGRVTMTAPSYPTAAQLLCALGRPPALAALNPQVGVIDPRRHWVHEGGALQWHFNVMWASGSVSVDPWRSSDEQIEGQRILDDIAESVTLPMADHPLRRLSNNFDAWVRDDDTYWSGISEALLDGPPAIPAFHVAGWHDLFCEGSLFAYEFLRDHRPDDRRAPQRLLVGPWMHGVIFGGQFGDLDFGPSVSDDVADFKGQMRRWLRDAAMGGDVDAGISLFVMGDNRWIDVAGWPPPSVPTSLYLSSTNGANSRHGDGLLLAAPSEAAGRDSFRYDPHNPVPSHGGRSVFMIGEVDGPRDQGIVEARGDVLVYTSEPLPVDLCVVGRVSAVVHFETSGRSADVTVKLVDVYPDGRAINVVDSVRRHDFSSARTEAVEIDVGSTAQTFKRGHRIRVQVSSSNFPRIDRNASTGRAPADADVLEPAEQTVYWGGRTPSRIVLPVLR